MISNIMGKIFGVLFLIGAVLVFINREKISDFKRNVIETVNPAAKEKRFITAIQNNLRELDSLLTGQNFEPGPTLSKKIAGVIGETKQNLDELQQTNNKLDLGANLSNLLQKIIPLGEPPSPTWFPPSQACPTPQ